MVPNPRKVARALRATVAVLAALGALTLVECGSGGGADDAGRAQRSSAFGGGTITSGGGGLSIVHVGSAFTGSGTSGAPLELSGFSCGGSAVSAVDANGSATCSAITSSVSVASPITGTGSAGNPLTTSLAVTSPVVGTGSAGNPLSTSFSVTSPFAGTGSAGSPFAYTQPALTCNNGQGISAIASNGVASCSNTGRNTYAGTHFEWSDEFLTECGNIANNGSISDWLYHTFSGTSAGAATAVGATSRPGVCEFQTGTTTTGRDAVKSSSVVIDYGSGNWTFEWVGGFPTLSTSVDEYSFIVGMDDQAGATQAKNGCYFAYDRGNVQASGPNTSNLNNWEVWCATNSTYTAAILDGTTNGGVATIASTVGAETLPNTNVYHLEIDVTGTSSAAFKINGTLVATITTNIPSGTHRTGVQFQLLKSAGTNERTADVDFMRLAVDLTSARSP